MCDIPNLANTYLLTHPAVTEQHYPAGNVTSERHWTPTLQRCQILVGNENRVRYLWANLVTLVFWREVRTKLPNPNQVVFMSEPNQTINAAVSQDTIENLNLTKRKVATLRNVRFQHIHSLQKCTLPYIYSSNWVLLSLIFSSRPMLPNWSNLSARFSHLSAAHVLSFSYSSQSLLGEWHFPLSKTSLNNFNNIFQQGGRFSSHGSHPSQIHSWTRKTLTSNSEMLHTKGNLVNTTRPGCESRAAAEAERPWWLLRLLRRGEVTLFPKGERAVTTWRLHKRLMPSATHTQNVTVHPLKKWDDKIQT